MSKSCVLCQHLVSMAEFYFVVLLHDRPHTRTQPTNSQQRLIADVHESHSPRQSPSSRRRRRSPQRRSERRSPHSRKSARRIPTDTDTGKHRPDAKHSSSSQRKNLVPSALKNTYDISNVSAPTRPAKQEPYHALLQPADAPSETAKIESPKLSQRPRTTLHTPRASDRKSLTISAFEYYAEREAAIVQTTLCYHHS